MLEDKGFYESGLSDEEKEELAMFVIHEWCAFAKISVVLSLKNT